MKLISPTERSRLNELVSVFFLLAGICALLSLVSYTPWDPSLNTAAPEVRPQNLLGYPGSYSSDLAFQFVGVVAFLIPVFLWLLSWKWVRSETIDGPGAKLFGAALLVMSLCAALSVRPLGLLWKDTTEIGGFAGHLLADLLLAALNITGAIIAIVAGGVLALYLLTTFSLATLVPWLVKRLAFLGRWQQRWASWRARRREAARERAAQNSPPWPDPKRTLILGPPAAPRVVPAPPRREPDPTPDDPPICEVAPEPPKPSRKQAALKPPPSTDFHIPPTSLLEPPPGRNPYDEEELKQLAVTLRAKFEEFSVHGAVTQINPGPVVTTYEYKPEAGIKYSRITTLAEDLCLGLQAESILIERIPGKSTVGIEVPNRKREVISLREIIESPEFQDSASRLTFSLGKDINGRIRVAALDAMPHLLIAGSTGSGKSVLMNCIIMSILYKSTPEEVRFILVDPKRLELGLYEDIPHLLTPVITDLKKAAYALRNATLEMERRLKLLAAVGVRNIEQYNRKVRAKNYEPLNLFDPDADGELRESLPYIVILIDELADLMLLEGNQVEEAITRLAQMARAVGIHLVLATQRPSVDVITGLIKANFPARISFRVATRVDSRTILDSIGAEALLGRGDMLYLPPGSGRMIRVHGPYVSEAEITQVVDFWKQQSHAEYEGSFLVAPPSREEREPEGEEGDEEDAEYQGAEDPRYQDAVRVVLEMGKASTSTLQRRLRLGYGRAARILDAMYADGIIGPPDGPRPREVLKRPDWLVEVEQ